MKKVIALLLLPIMGCATIRRHPALTGIVAGAAAGTAIGLATRRGTCPTVVNGYPYNGTPPCPGPNYDPGSKKR